jgi:hypothetical protein
MVANSLTPCAEATWDRPTDVISNIQYLPICRIRYETTMHKAFRSHSPSLHQRFSSELRACSSSYLRTGPSCGPRLPCFQHKRQSRLGTRCENQEPRGRNVPGRSVNQMFNILATIRHISHPSTPFSCPSIPRLTISALGLTSLI